MKRNTNHPDDVVLVNCSRLSARERAHPSLARALRQQSHAERGLLLLRDALAEFKLSDNVKVQQRIRFAISSAKGAQRIVDHRVIRARIALEDRKPYRGE